MLNSKGADAHEVKLHALKEKILFLYDSENDPGIRSLIKNQPINLLVEALESLDDLSIIIRFVVISYKIKMGDLFLSFSQRNRLRILGEIKTGVLSHLLNDLNTDDLYEIFTDAPSSIQKKIIFNASKEMKEEIKNLKSFDFAQVGSIMNTSFLTLLEGMKVSEAINFLRINSQDFDIGEEVFVVNADDEVVGKIKTKDLIFSNRKVSINELLDKSFLSVSVSDDIDEIVDIFRKYSTVSSVSVLDESSKIVGVVTNQDVIPEILDSSIEDFYKFYGIRDTRKPYLKSGILEIAKSRIFCLIIMLFTATFTTFVIDKFESLGVYWTAGISSAILVPMIPVITDMCGNTGSQTTATVIQAVSLGEISYSDFWKVAKKEVKVAMVIGGILALCNFARLMVYFLISQPDQSKFHIASAAANAISSWKLYGIGMIGAFSSSLSLFLVVIFSKFFGVLVPFLAIRFDKDPASVSAPILTTILDTVSSVIFFGIGLFLFWFTLNKLGIIVRDGKINGNSMSVALSSFISDIKLMVASKLSVWI